MEERGVSVGDGEPQAQVPFPNFVSWLDCSLSELRQNEKGNGSRSPEPTVGGDNPPLRAVL